MDDAEHIKELSLVLMDALHLYIKHSIYADLSPKPP